MSAFRPPKGTTMVVEPGGTMTVSCQPWSATASPGGFVVRALIWNCVMCRCMGWATPVPFTNVHCSTVLRNGSLALSRFQSNVHALSFQAQLLGFVVYCWLVLLTQKVVGLPLTTVCDRLIV